MLRRVLLKKVFTRSVYIPSASANAHTSRWVRQSPKAEELAAKEEAALLDAQLKELKQKQKEYQLKLKEARDRELQQKLAERDNLKLTGEASAEELAALESHLSKPLPELLGSLSKHAGKTFAIPASITKLLPARNPHSSSYSKSMQLFSKQQRINWMSVVSDLSQLPLDIPARDVEQFVSSIPLKQRTQLVEKLESIIPNGLQTQFVKDQLMAGYAHDGRVQDVKRIMSTCDTLTMFSYGHLVKSLFKVGSQPESLFAVIKNMREDGIDPSLPIMSTAVQSLIQHGRHKEAETLFDNMKYWSVETQPDKKLYNSIILSAAKQHNVNRCLDLLTEMKERRPHPLQPDAETYNYVVYACARDPKTHLTAWDLFMEARQLGFEANLQSFRALMYLCGASGEVLLSRALIRNLSATSPQFIDEYALNCLFMAYRCWKPGPSQILSSPSGQSIRANIMMNPGNSDFTGDSKIPLLPMANLDAKLVMLESSAVFEYYADTSPQTLAVENRASLATSPVVYNFLQVAINLGEDIQEFRRRFTRFTRFHGDETKTELLAPKPTEVNTATSSSSSDSKDLTGPHHPNYAADRDQYLYRLAIKAAIKFKDLDFGRQIWTERGLWRRQRLFREYTQEQRNIYDFQFARDLVELLAVCGRIEEALLLVKSAQNLRKWRKHHLTALFTACEQLEDMQTINQLTKILKPMHIEE